MSPGDIVYVDRRVVDSFTHCRSGDSWYKLNHRDAYLVIGVLGGGRVALLHTLGIRVVAVSDILITVE